MKDTKTVFVTGATGFVGRHLLAAVIHKRLANKFNFILLSRREVPVNPDFQLVVADLCDEDVVRKQVRKSDVVIHLASVLDSSDKNLEKVNVDASLDILRSLKKGAKFIFLSSATVNYPIKTRYANSKLIVEKRIKESNINYTIIRPSWIYGNGSRSFEKLLNYAKNSRVIPVINQMIQPVFVGDVVDLIINSTDKYDRETIEIAGEKIAYQSFVERIAAFFGKKPLVVRLPYVFFWLLFNASQILPIKILTKDSLVDFEYSTNVDLKLLKKKYGVTPKSVDVVLSEKLIE
ncbi:NAD-dependent epimerase/dehydratase family protein [Candidatus Micrarchaeota archaeon]|nr:NAD-dependent epimerase/dehydratase family protein [Candidatus Micrarchaeota archaeon]